MYLYFYLFSCIFYSICIVYFHISLFLSMCLSSFPLDAVFAVTGGSVRSAVGFLHQLTAPISAVSWGTGRWGPDQLLCVWERLHDSLEDSSWRNRPGSARSHCSCTSTFMRPHVSSSLRVQDLLAEPGAGDDVSLLVLLLLELVKQFHSCRVVHGGLKPESLYFYLRYVNKTHAHAGCHDACF